MGLLGSFKNAIKGFLDIGEKKLEDGVKVLAEKELPADVAVKVEAAADAVVESEFKAIETKLLPDSPA